MRFAAVVLVACTLAGCSGEGGSMPTAPAPIPVPAPPAPTADPVPPPRLASIWVVVLEEQGSGACIRNATIEIVGGPGLGSRIEQNNECSYWDPDYRAVFDRLPAGENVKLRASAAGYSAAELTVIPAIGASTAVTIALTKTR
jgi:hypothetical protein